MKFLLGDTLIQSLFKNKTQIDMLEGTMNLSSMNVPKQQY